MTRKSRIPKEMRESNSKHVTLYENSVRILFVLALISSILYIYSNTVLGWFCSFTFEISGLQFCSTNNSTVTDPKTSQLRQSINTMSKPSTIKWQKQRYWSHKQTYRTHPMDMFLPPLRPWVLPRCHEWNWKDQRRNELPNEVQKRIREPVDTAALKAAKIDRIDRSTFALKTGGKPQQDYAQFHWAWHSGTCNGLRDDKWYPSDGMALFTNMKADVLRLKTLGILQEQGSIAIDIGAHSGDSTIPIALLANRTIAFDPNDDVFKILRINALLNPHLNIDTYSLAIAQNDSVLTFQYGWSIKKRNEFQCNGGITGVTGNDIKELFVQKKAVNLFSFLVRTYGLDIIPQIKYIKIDAEGFDSTILQSIHKIIEISQPAIQVEFFEAFKSQNKKLRDVKLVESQGSTNKQELDKQQLSPGAIALFKAIRNVPGNYSVYCTYQCNDILSCKHKHGAMAPIIISDSSPLYAYIVDSSKNQIEVKCADLILIPQKS